MIDPLILLTPLLLLPIVALLRFVGCAALLDVDSFKYADPPKVSGESDPSPSNDNDEVTLTAKVIATSAPAPKGHVSFAYGATKLGPFALSPDYLIPNVSNAQSAPVRLPQGMYHITIEYDGDKPKAFQRLRHEVLPSRDFDLSPNTQHDEVRKGGSMYFGLLVTPKHGFNSPVDLKLTNVLPQGVTYRFDPAQVITTAGPAQAKLHITTSSTAARGSVQFQIVSQGSGVTKAASATLNVT